jgi:hypothetical protein
MVCRLVPSISWGSSFSVVLDVEMDHRSVHEGLPSQLSGMRHYQQRRRKQTGFIGAQEKTQPV